jgi:hypothetical protein
MPKRVLFKSQPVGLVVGLALFGAGWYVLYNTYEGRGSDQPWPLKVISWW